MELQKQVVSLELSKKLKSLGVKQESLFYWVDRGNLDRRGKGEMQVQCADCADEYGNEKHFSAFTVAELVNMLTEVGIDDNISLREISPDFLANKLINL
jgi:hypothetical protein